MLQSAGKRKVQPEVVLLSLPPLLATPLELSLLAAGYLVSTLGDDEVGRVSLRARMAMRMPCLVIRQLHVRAHVHVHVHMPAYASSHCPTLHVHCMCTACALRTPHPRLRPRPIGRVYGAEGMPNR